LLADISARIAGMPGTEADEVLDYALGRLGEFTGANRTFLIHPSHLPPARQSPRKVREWCRAGVEPCGAALGSIAAPGGWLAAQLSGEGHLFIPGVDELPAEAAVERGALRSLSIQSLAAVPVAYGGNLASILAVEPRPGAQAWSEADTALLSVVGNLIAGALKQQETQLELAPRTSELRSDGEHPNVAGFREDLDERRRNELDLREELAQIKGAIDSAMDAVVTLDADQRILLFNQAAETMFRCSAHQALGQPLDMFIPLRFREAHRRHVARFAKTNYTTRSMGVPDAVVGLRADGEEFPIEASISQANVKGEKLLTVIMRDVTQRKRAEEALIESEQMFRSVAQSVSEALISTDSAGNILFWNRGAQDIFGYTEEEALGERVTLVIPERRRQEIHTAMAEAELEHSWAERDAPWSWAGLRKDGSEFSAEVGLATWQMKGKRFYTAIVHDVTEREQAEEALRRSEEKYRNLVENTSDWIWTMDRLGRITYSSPSVERILGYKPEELVGLDSRRLMHPEEREELEASLPSPHGHHTVRKEAVGRWRHKDGTYRYLESNATPLLDERSVLVGYESVARDVTPGREAELALKESEELFRGAFMYAPIGMALVAPDGRYLQVNRSMCSLLGYSEQELLQKAFVDITHPEDVEADLASVRLMLGGEADSYVREKRYIHKQGHAVSTLLTASPVRDAAGDVYCFITHVIDMTERNRTAELSLAKEAAEQANRSKSEFLARMSHELRTPLNSILGFAQLLQMEALDREQQESVRYIVKGGQHLLQLINEVLDISRIEAGRMYLSTEPVSVRDVLQECLQLVQPMVARRGLRMQVDDLERCNLWAMADNQRLKQVLLNLVTNAIKYNREGGSVSLSCAEYGERSMRTLRILVSDTGPGIPPEKQVRLFSPFDRLGAEQTGVEGTGLGLALSRRLVEAMKGTIGMESTAGKGSTFWVELPIAEVEIDWLERANSGRLTTSHLSDTQLGRTILYIEDNLSNLKLVERILERRPGIRLLSALQGGLGLELARQHRPDLVLLDVHLPDMSGEQVLRSLRGDPSTRDLPVIVISADANAGRADRLLEAGAQGVLTKPLDVKKFDRAVRAALD
jgi:PAS domain S-box-containing protein